MGLLPTLPPPLKPRRAEALEELLCAKPAPLGCLGCWVTASNPFVAAASACCRAVLLRGDLDLLVHAVRDVAE
eukprot:5883567-Pyramimonas_sp.AAC.1